jgi:hypothetical protein
MFDKLGTKESALFTIENNLYACPEAEGVKHILLRCEDNQYYIGTIFPNNTYRVRDSKGWNLAHDPNTPFEDAGYVIE